MPDLLFIGSVDFRDEIFYKSLLYVLEANIICHFNRMRSNRALIKIFTTIYRITIKNISVALVFRICLVIVETVNFGVAFRCRIF